MSLYNRCLLTIIKNDVEVDFLPKPLLEDIKLLHSLHQKWTNKLNLNIMYWSTFNELIEILEDTKRCADCDYASEKKNPICVFIWKKKYPTTYCDFHQLVTDYLRHKRRELLKIIWETNNVYWDEIDKVCKTSPQFADVLYHLRLIS